MVALAAAIGMIALITAGAVRAQNVNIDLGKLDAATAARVLDAKKSADEKILAASKAAEALKDASPARAKEWADIGESLAKAVAATAKALSIEVNEFVKTPVGWWAMVFIFWYLLGHKLWAIVGGTFMWMTLMYLLWKSYRRFFFTTQVLVKQNADGTKVYEQRGYDWHKDRAGNTSGDARGLAAFMHLTAFTVATLVCMFIIF